MSDDPLLKLGRQLSETDCCMDSGQLLEAVSEHDALLLAEVAEHAGLVLNREKDQWECFCGESLGTYVLPFDKRREIMTLDTELSFARVKHREHILSLRPDTAATLARIRKAEREKANG